MNKIDESGKGKRIIEAGTKEACAKIADEYAAGQQDHHDNGCPCLESQERAAAARAIAVLIRKLK